MLVMGTIAYRLWSRGTAVTFEVVESNCREQGLDQARDHGVNEEYDRIQTITRSFN